ncbi:MAG: carbohydrate ABC transporter permease [bacterium]
MSVYLLMVIPLLVVIAIFFVYPLTQIFYLSFYEYTPLVEKKFLGFGAYARVLSDEVFIATILRSLIFVGVTVGANLMIGMGFALLTYKEVPGVKLLRTILIIPMLFIPAASAITWSLLYNEQIGLINHFLKAIGIRPREWLAHGSTAFPAVMVADIWGWLPFVYLILLAGLQSLPTECFEAADIDGASAWQKFWHVTLPMMEPIIAIATILKSLDAFRTFVYMWVMTRGGPGDSTQVLSTLIFSKAFRLFKYGSGSTMAAITWAMAFVMSLAFLLVFRERARREI